MEILQIGLGLGLLFLWLLMIIFFLLKQQRVLKDIRSENRRLAPGKVWMQLIPLYGLIYQFIVLGDIADSIHAELSAPTQETILGGQHDIPVRPTYNLGVTYAALFCISIFPVPFIKPIAASAGLGVWIWYWVELHRYHKKIIQSRILVS